MTCCGSRIAGGLDKAAGERHISGMFGRSGNREARLRYLPNGIQMLSSGDHVICAQSGVAVPLNLLRYWSVERQEAYAGPEEAAAALLPEGERPRS